MKKLYIKTYGCQMNEYDSVRLRDLFLASHEFTMTNQPEDADVILLNTCSVREKAQEKVFSDLGRLRLIKNKNPELIIGVGGCVASQAGRVIFQRAPYVDIVFGPQTLHRVPAMLQKVIQDKKPCIDIDFPAIEKFDYLPMPEVDQVTASVTIMEGCNNFCSYCIVPYVRGREISRPLQSILAEVHALAEQGVREITLLGQNVNSYRGAINDHESANLATLIREIATIETIARIRFMTSHPKDFSEDLIAVYRDIPEVVNHLHLPVQSGSNRILHQMNRGYTVETFIERVNQLRAIRPDVSITSDFIVGFPSETEADFQATLDLIETIGFDHSFNFIYSARPGTASAKLVDDVPLEIKKSRLYFLQDALSQSEQKISQSSLGTIQTMLVTDYAKKASSQLTGRTENNRVVNFQGSDKLLGNFVRVKITEILPNSLRGELV